MFRSRTFGARRQVEQRGRGHHHLQAAGRQLLNGGLRITQSGSVGSGGTEGCLRGFQLIVGEDRSRNPAGTHRDSPRCGYLEPCYSPPPEAVRYCSALRWAGSQRLMLQGSRRTREGLNHQNVQAQFPEWTFRIKVAQLVSCCTSDVDFELE